MVRLSDVPDKTYAKLGVILLCFIAAVGIFNSGRLSRSDFINEAFTTIERLEDSLEESTRRIAELTAINSELTSTIERSAELTKQTSDSISRAGNSIESAIAIVDELERYIINMGELLY